MNELSKHHYKVWEAWGNKVRGETITADCIKDHAPLHQEIFYEIQPDGTVAEKFPPNPEDTFYVTAVQDNVKYIVPVRYLADLPIKPKTTIKARLKKSDTKVYEIIRDRITLKVPLKILRSGSEIKQFIDTEFNPVVHENPKQWFIMKCISLCPEIKAAICANVGFGKQSNMTILKSITGKYAPKVIKPSQAKLWATMQYNHHINLDEITSWSPESVHNVEDLFAAGADESPDMDKYALDRNKGMEVMGLSQKSLTFTFNRPDELHKKKGKPFEEKFENPTKIIDRYPRLLFSGKVISRIEKPNPAEAKELMEQNFKEMCIIASKVQFIRDNYHMFLHGYDWDKVMFERRHLANLTPLIKMLDVVSETKQEFDDWVKVLTDARDDYDRMLSGQIITKSDTINQTKFDNEEIDFSA